jgi:hypothetical protein
MSVQTFANGYGDVIVPGILLPSAAASFAQGTADAVGESTAFVGYMFLTTGPGTSKTISTGKVYFRTGSITFASGSSTFKVGIQDVGATGLEDGTYDVFGTLTGGGGGLTANAVNSVTMSSGTKTITHGDLVAIVLEVTARGGADSIQISRSTASSSMPYVTADTGAGPAKVTVAPICTVEFDDGTMGWFGGDSFACDDNTSGTGTFASNSTPDEYCTVFRLPIASECIGAMWGPLSYAATDDHEILLYSDPLGTPAVERTATVDADLRAFPSSGWSQELWASFSLAANTDYAIAIRPTTTNTLAVRRLAFGTGNGNLRKVTRLGTNWLQGTRSDQTGAFSTSTLFLPCAGPIIRGWDSGSAGGTVIAGTTLLRGMVS